MKKKKSTSRRMPTLTSDRWHVIHARFSKTNEKRRPFTRSIVSEHDDKKAAVRAARILLFTLRRNSDGSPIEERDQVFVRQPNYKSFAVAARRVKKI